MTEPEILDFAHRFIGAIQSGDVETVRASYAPDAKIWHNHDGLEQTVDQNMKSLGWFIRKIPVETTGCCASRRCTTAMSNSTSSEATLPDGTPWAMPACVVIRMENGLITRLDEYLDSAQAAALSAFGR